LSRLTTVKEAELDTFCLKSRLLLVGVDKIPKLCFGLLLVWHLSGKTDEDYISTFFHIFKSMLWCVCVWGALVFSLLWQSFIPAHGCGVRMCWL